MYSCSGLGAFPQFPKEETLLNKREKKVNLRVPP
jgi:hypothetical protein